jgi:hypothetical protein
MTLLMPIVYPDHMTCLYVNARLLGQDDESRDDGHDDDDEPCTDFALTL